MQILKVRAARVAFSIFGVLLFAATLASAQTGSTLKVLDWNTHHGVGSDGAYSLDRFIPWIVRSGAQVVSLNEVEKNTGWGDEDQPARYAALLKAATGKTWYYTFAQRDGDTDGQGNLILSIFPIEASGSKTLSYSRSVARAQIVVNGIRVNVFSTHLDADSAARRSEQMAELKSWSSGFSQQHIIAGDFNAWPGAAEIANMTAFCYDAWAVAKSKSTAVAYAGNDAGNTRNSRIDYIWYSQAASRLVLKGAQVFDTRDSNGVMPSDHRPVMATFQVGSATATVTKAAGGDFDGDGKADVSVYRPATAGWFIVGSGGAAMQWAWGVMGDIPAAGDYDGDGRMDVAVFRPAEGAWYIRSSSNGAESRILWGSAADIPVAGDYDADGRTDVAVFRPANGVWYVRYSKSGASSSSVAWGAAGDKPVPGDYDRDGATDLAVFRPASGTWYVRFSSNGATGAFQWGTGSDVAAPADYDGDGRTDAAVFRPAEGRWYVRSSANGALSSFQWGIATDRPVAADYDGDGRADFAVFRPAAGVWYIRYSSTGGSSALQWGNSADQPVLQH